MAFIFDLDGVLVFTDAFHYKAWKRLADEMDIYFDEEINNKLRGVSRMASLEIILERYTGEALSEQRKIELTERKNAIYRSFLETMTPADVSDEVRDTLRRLRDAGCRLAVGSSSKNAKLILDKVKLTDQFDAISDGTNISKSKPDPEVFLKAAGFLREKPEDCFVVEDARAGIDAAKACGMRAIGIGEAAFYDKADIGVSSFSDLYTIYVRARDGIL